MEHVVPRSARSVGVVTTVRAAVALLTRLPVGAIADVPGAWPSPWSGPSSGGWRRRRWWSWPWPASRCWVRSPRSGCSPVPAAYTWTVRRYGRRPGRARRLRRGTRSGGSVRRPGGAVALLVVLGAEFAALASVTASGDRWWPGQSSSSAALCRAGCRCWRSCSCGPGRRRRSGRVVQQRRLRSRCDRRGGHGRGPGRGRDGPGWMGAGSGSADRHGGRPGRDGLHHARLRGRLDGDGLGASVEITLTATLVCLAVMAQ